MSALRRGDGASDAWPPFLPDLTEEERGLSDVLTDALMCLEEATHEEV